ILIRNGYALFEVLRLTVGMEQHGASKLVRQREGGCVRRVGVRETVHIMHLEADEPRLEPAFGGFLDLRGLVRRYLDVCHKAVRVFRDGFMNKAVAAFGVFQGEHGHVGDGCLRDARAVYDLDEAVATRVGDAEGKAPDVGVHVDDLEIRDWKSLAAALK
ncbi:MAG: hypothetical protein U9Q79_06675, partial [Candidatus Hydrogenedentes bacterium]|nr:hypothetical protein [Candidatus Hydrogenedentota bacterium]